MALVSFTALRANLASHMDQVLADRTELVVTRQNREPVVMLPLSELEGLRETLHLLSSPANAERLRRSVAELDHGQGVPFDLPEA